MNNCKPTEEYYCGHVCSGLPICCVSWWIWAPYSKWYEKLQELRGSAFSYVPCPLHLVLGTERTLRPCTPEDLLKRHGLIIRDGLKIRIQE